MAKQRLADTYLVQKNAEVAWTLLFDPATERSDREAIKQAFRNEIERGQFFGGKRRPVPARQREYELQLEEREESRLTLALVMVDGYHEHTQTFKFLRDRAMADRCVLIGYSSGLSNTRRFSDGTSMAGRIFVPDEDLQALMLHRESPLLLCDIHPYTGMTYAAIGTTLRESLGYKGHIYQIVGNDIKRWHGRVSDSAKSLPKNVPILTDHTVERLSLLRSS